MALGTLFIVAGIIYQIGKSKNAVPLAQTGASFGVAIGNDLFK